SCFDQTCTDQATGFALRQQYPYMVQDTATMACAHQRGQVLCARHMSDLLVEHTRMPTIVDNAKHLIMRFQPFRQVRIGYHANMANSHTLKASEKLRDIWGQFADLFWRQPTFKRRGLQSRLCRCAQHNA